MSSIPLEFSETKLTRVAADWISGALWDGALAIDATVGNGYDTLFPCSRSWSIGTRDRF